MNAQQLINETPSAKQTDFLKMFYPKLANQRDADKNLSLCARSQKWVSENLSRIIMKW